VTYLLTVAGAALALTVVAPTSRLILLSVPADPEAARRVVADSKTPEAAAMVGD
tara:strand:- start:102551 stop:102712 length:162 start_codon:yes stop_codon:yes gene_type:complete